MKFNLKVNSLLIVTVVLITGMLLSGCIDSEQCTSHSPDTQSTAKPCIPQPCEPLETYLSFDLSETNTEIKRLTSAEGIQMNPIWTPDGENIVYEQDGDIFVVGINGDEPLKLASGYNPIVSSDGHEVLFLRVGTLTGSFNHETDTVEVIAVDISSHHERRIRILDTSEAKVNRVVRGGEGYVQYGRLSPSGKHLSLWCRQERSSRLALWDIEDGGLTIIDSLVPESYGSWNYDETLFVFSALSDEDIAGDSDPHSDIWQIDLNSGQMSNLTSTPYTHEFSPTYSPDGSKIAYKSGSSEDYGMWISCAEQIWTMDPDGNNKHLVIKRYLPYYSYFSDNQLVWYPTSSSLSMVTWGFDMIGNDIACLTQGIWDIGKESDPHGGWQTDVNHKWHVLSFPCSKGTIGSIAWSADGSKIAFEWAPDTLLIEEHDHLGVIVHAEFEEADQHIYSWEVPKEWFEYHEPKTQLYPSARITTH